MTSRTPSLDSSLVLKDSGSSRTSPSRLPRMLVEYHPETPSMRVLKAGARTVLMKVCPVLKSLPQMGAFILRESSLSAGMSTVRLGAPLAKGMPSLSAAQAYIIEGEMPGSLSTSPFSNASSVLWTAVCSRKISVDPHQIMTWRSVLVLNLAMSHLFLPVFDLLGVRRLT